MPIINDEILSDAELLRYSRQISIKAMDIEGQEKLKQAKVLMIGVGGLGSAVGQYLTVAGVGTLSIVDFDTVDISNLQRQVLHHDNNVGQAKVDSAKMSLSKLNPYIRINAINAKLDSNRINDLVITHDLVVDCTDNIQIREQLNQACFTHKKPFISGAAIRMEGTVTVFDYSEHSACYQCYSALFGKQQLTCVESGILAPVVGIIGCIQATEVLKIITNMGTSLAGRLLIIDAMTMEFREITIPKQPLCKVCSTN